VAGLKSWAPTVLRAPAATRRWRAALILCLLLAAVVAPPYLPPFLLTVVMLSLVYAMLAMSLDVLMGYTGMESLGQAAFFGIGAYTVGIITTRHGSASWPVAVVVALALGTVSAALAGLLAVRLHGLFFLVMTLAFSQVLWGVSQSWDTMTGGYLGITGIPRPYPSLGSDVHFYYVVLGVFVLVAFLMLRLVSSAFGLGLRGIRESESRMMTSGFNVWLHKYIVFVLCGFFAAIAGVLYAFAIQFASPDVLSITTSFNAMLMVIIGGAGTLVGPVIGATGIVFLQNYVSGYITHWIILLGAIYIAAALFARKGLVGEFRVWYKWVKKKVLRERSEVADSGTSWPASRPASGIALRASSATKREEPGESTALRLTGLSKSFGMIRAVENVSITADVGTRMAILGPNGAGKTTLFNLISGLHKPSSGDISLFGKSIARVSPHARVRMGLARTYQVTNLYPTLTVLDNIRLGVLGIDARRYALHSSVAGVDRINERSRELLQLIGLWERRDMEVQHLSYGHQRQIEIIMALASEPRVLLLDEPAAGLSVAETQPMVELIRELDPALTLLIIEHDMDVAFEVATEITVLHNGQVLAQGTREEIKANSSVRDVYLGTAFS
jgi:ABC-type branched-subunit amino acid transport system ATPase component/ABC-type branched-subunit amino acid transport system permease subunit